MGMLYTKPTTNLTSHRQFLKHPQPTKKSVKEVIAEELAAYRERYFVAIFESIKVQYQDKYEQYAKTGYMFAGMVEKVPPEKLKLGWFMEPRQRTQTSTWGWKAFCQTDPLMKELKNIKGGGKWKEKIAKMQVHMWLLSPHTYLDFLETLLNHTQKINRSGHEIRFP